MDQRHQAGTSGQPNQASPQRRLYVYDRPFADIRPPAHKTPSRPTTPPVTQQPAPMQQPVQTRLQPQKPAVHTIDGFMPPGQQRPPVRQPQPFKLQQPVASQELRPVSNQQPVTPSPHPQHQQQHTVSPSLQQSATSPSQQNHTATVSTDEKQWHLELPEDLQEQRQPINSRPQPQSQNPNWHPIQATQTASPASASWEPPLISQQPAYEQQFQHNARRQYRGPLAVLRSLIPQAIKVMAIMILMAGVFVAVSMIRANQSTKNMTGNFNQAESDDLGIFNTQPNEAAATGTLGISQTADAPKAMKIDAIDMTARIVTVGTSRNSYVKAPANIYDIGWYEGSSKPGQNGVVLMHGHIAGPTRPGALYEVALLKRGDVITVERGDGKVYNYTVQYVEFFENDQMDMSKMLTPYNPNRNGLNIMTAGGRYNTETGAYELRAAVYAVEDTN